MASAAPINPTVNPGIDLNVIAGPVLVGVLINSMLGGFCFLQSAKYFTYFEKDNWTLRILVIALLLLDLLGVVNSIAIAYMSFVKNFGNYLFLLNQGPMYIVYGCSTATTTLLAQSFLVWRVYKISKNYIVCVVLAAVSVMGVIGAYYTNYLAATSVGDLASRELLTVTVHLWNIGAAVSDILTAAALIFYITRLRSSFARTNSILRKLVIYAIPSGAATAANATGAFIAYKVATETQIPFAFTVWIGRLYSLTVLFNLNLRHEIDEQSSKSSAWNSTNTANLSTSSHFGGFKKGLHSRPTETLALQPIHMSREERTMVDEEKQEDKPAAYAF